MYCPKVLGGKRPFLYKYMIQSLKMTLLLHFSVGVVLYTTTLPPWPMSLFGYHGAYYIHLPSAPPFANNSQHSTAYMIVTVQTHPSNLSFEFG